MWPFKQYIPDEVVKKELAILSCAYDNGILTKQELIDKLDKLYRVTSTGLLLELEYE